MVQMSKRGTVIRSIPGIIITNMSYFLYLAPKNYFRDIFYADNLELFLAVFIFFFEKY